VLKHDYRQRRNGCTQRYLPTDQVEDKVADCLETYVQASDALRGIYDQSFFEKIWSGEEGLDLRVPFAHLLAHDLAERLKLETAALSNPNLSTYRRRKPIDRSLRPRGALPSEDRNHDLLLVGHGSNVSCVVGLVGLERRVSHLRLLRRMDRVLRRAPSRMGATGSFDRAAQ
jgi:hypothetical protein